MYILEEKHYLLQEEIQEDSKEFHPISKMSSNTRRVNKLSIKEEKLFPTKDQTHGFVPLWRPLCIALILLNFNDRGGILGIVGWDPPSVCKSNRLHVDILRLGANEVIGANYTVTTFFFKSLLIFLAQISIDYY